jgi:MFS transporter, DHA2 family, methylenomycin A resistance protein
MDSSERRALRSVTLFIAGNVLFGTGLIFHAFLYNFYLEALHLSVEVMGRAAAALTGGGLAVLLPAGALADRVGPRASIVTAAVVLTLGLVLGAVATTPAAVYGGAALAGAGSAVWRVAVGPVLMGLTGPRTRARAFAWNVGLLVGWGGVGTALAGAASAWLEGRWALERLAAMRVALVLGAALSAASIVLFRAVRPSPQRGAEPLAPDAAPATAQPHGAAGRVPWENLPLVAFVAAWMLGPALAAPFFNIFFSRAHGLSLERIGYMFAAVQVCTALAVVGSGEVVSRMGVHRVLAGTLVFFAPAIWGLALVGTVGLAVALYFLQGLISPVTNPLIDQWLLGRTAAGRRGTVASWRQVAADVSAMIGAALGGRLLATGTFDTLFVAAGAIGLVGALGLIAGVHWRPAPDAR